MKPGIKFQLVIWVLTLGFLLPQSAISQGIFDKKKNSDQDAPIEITSDRMRSENGGQIIIFSGNVIGNWGKLRITSDILEIRNSKNKKDTEEIVAIGNVFITRGDRRAKGDRAVYIDKQQKVILTGSPRATAWEAKNMIEGREMIFLLDKDRFVVNDRVRMKIYPKGKKKPGDRKKAWENAKK